MFLFVSVIQYKFIDFKCQHIYLPFCFSNPIRIHHNLCQRFSPRSSLRFAEQHLRVESRREKITFPSQVLDVSINGGKQHILLKYFFGVSYTFISFRFFIALFTFRQGPIVQTDISLKLSFRDNNQMQINQNN